MNVDHIDGAPITGPARIVPMPPSPETARRYYEVHCRVCTTHEGMYEDPFNETLARLLEQHNQAHRNTPLPVPERPKPADHDHQNQPKAWCRSCSHVHIASIPPITYLCSSSCGYAGWTLAGALEHEAHCPGHRTYTVEHQLEPLRDAVIVDMDGTLVDVSGVRHYVMGDPRRKDFEHFHAGAALCPPIGSTVRWVAAQRALGNKVLVVTSRKQRWEYQTRRWLRKWEIEYDALYMRPDDDNRPDVQVKGDILRTIRDTAGVRVVAAIDDNPNVIALWESEGIPTTVVPGWDTAAAWAKGWDTAVAWANGQPRLLTPEAHERITAERNAQ